MKKDITVTSEAIKVLLKKHGYSLCSIVTHDGGFWNPVFFLTTAQGTELVLKVTNPLWPVRKTLNEVTVISHVSKTTKIPVPAVVAYSLSREELGYEYILMERIPGRSLASIFDTLAKQDQIKYLDQLVEIVQQLFSVQFQEIGGFSVGMKVTVDPWHGKGPYKTVSDYLNVEMQQHLDSLTANSSHLGLVERFRAFKDKFVQNCTSDCNIVLSHNDLQLKNIIVEGGQITGLIDWEWAMAAPSDLYFSTLANTFDDLNEESRNYLYESLESRGIIKDKRIRERESLFEAANMLSCLACYKPHRWYVDLAEEKRYETDLISKINEFLGSHNV